MCRWEFDTGVVKGGDVLKIAWINFDMSDCGGSQQVLSNLVNAMEADHEMHVVSLIQEKPAWQYTFSNQVHCETIVPKKARIREAIRLGGRKLRTYIRENKIDLVFYVGAYAGLCAGYMLRRARCHKVFCDHGALMNQWNELPARLMRRIGSRNSDRTVVLTRQSEQAYYEKFREYKRGRVVTIYNWMDDRILEDAVDYNESSRKILTAGRFSHEKGYDLLVKVAESLREKADNWEWDIYGAGDMFDEIQKEIQEKGLDKQVHLLGLTNQMSKCYADHALYVLTSYREGLPLVLIEAKANHLPIVSFDIVSGPAEIVTDQKNGILIPPYDTEAMADAIAELLNDDDKRCRMSADSSDRMELFQKSAILRQWRELIREFDV